MAPFALTNPLTVLEASLCDLPTRPGSAPARRLHSELFTPLVPHSVGTDLPSGLPPRWTSYPLSNNTGFHGLIGACSPTDITVHTAGLPLDLMTNMQITGICLQVSRKQDKADSACPTVRVGQGPHAVAFCSPAAWLHGCRAADLCYQHHPTCRVTDVASSLPGVSRPLAWILECQALPESTGIYNYRAISLECPSPNHQSGC